jgi:hypothetical protein
MTIALSPKTLTEEKVITFDFTSQAGPRGRIDTVEVLTVSVDPASVMPDPGTPLALLLGTPVILGDAPMVLVLVKVGVEGCLYDLFCAGRAKDGQRHEIKASLLINSGVI